MKIEKRLLKDTKNRYQGTNGKQYIVVHQTGNTDVGADAEAHHELQRKGNVREASWHIQVDDKTAIQSFPYDFRLWHAGDGKAPNGGNYNGIGVEICINKDGDYKKAVENGAKVVAILMKELNLPISRVKQHNHFSGKNCPAQIRAGKEGIDWIAFKELVQGTSKPAKKPVAKASETNSIVDYLVSIKEDSGFANRAKLAKKHGIKNYTGTALQNLTLLSKLRSGAKPKKYTKALDETSIVDFLRKNGESSSFATRKRLAQEHGIKGYQGTASQNVKLLNILKGK